MKSTRYYGITGFLLLLVTVFTMQEGYAQNAIIGSGFGANDWSTSDCFNDGAGGSRIRIFNANGTGNQFFRFVTCWDGNWNQWGPFSTSNNYEITSGEAIPSSNIIENGTASEYFINVSSTSHNYVFKTQSGGNPPPNRRAVVFEVQGAIRSVNNVTTNIDHNDIIAGDSVVVTATLDGALSGGQAVWLRYSNDGFTTSEVVKMTGSGTSYTAAIARDDNMYNQAVSYYVFTSGDVVSIAHADADLYTINLNNNGGSNYSYTPGFYRISPASPTSTGPISITMGRLGTDLSTLPNDEEVYVHMGAILQGAAATAWDVTKGNWGQGDGLGEMDSINAYQSEFTFKPNAYFSEDSPDPNAGLSNPEEVEAAIEFDSISYSIFRLGFVFRSSSGDLIVKDDGSASGNDIYLDLDPGYWLLLDPPNRLEKNVAIDLATASTTYTIAGSVSTSSTITVDFNGENIFSGTASNFSVDVNQLDTLQYGIYPLTVEATNGTDTKTFTRNLNVYNSDELVVLSSSLDPALPTAETAITLTFNAFNTTLENADKVYLHSAAVMESPTSETWGATIGNWGQDDGIGLMTETSPGSNIWTITLTPSDYYFPVDGLDPDLNIFRLAMVFRNADGTVQQKGRDGNDIYLDIDPGFYIVVNAPASDSFVAVEGGTFSIQATASESADFTVTINSPTPYNNSATGVTNIDFDTSVPTAGSYTITISATNGSVTKQRNVSLGIYSPVTIADHAAGLQYGPNYDAEDPRKATLLVHLPTQGPINVVHVIGDFNDWTISEAYKMNRTTAGDVWWLEIDNLTPGKEYVYQYLVNGSVKAGDPYAEKISDPDDQFISEARYPGLIDYPSNKTEFRATVLQTRQEDYVWQVNNFDRPELYKVNMYELLIRDFTEAGTYQAVIDSLDYIASLGFNAIHLMPTSEFEGNESWGYNPNYYFAPDKFYGPKNKLKELVDEAHKRGIAIVGDLVLNHSFYSSPFARFYWNDGGPGSVICAPNRRPTPDNPWFNECHNFIDERAAWWGADFNHESTHTQALVDSITDYWMTEYRFDGFRFDFTKGFSNTSITCPDCWGSSYDAPRIANLERMKNEMLSRHPGAYVIFEHLANADEDRHLANQDIHMWGGAGITKRYESIVLGYEDTNRDLSNGVYNAAPTYFAFSNLMSYMESHDEERLAYEIATYGRDFIRNEMNADARDWDDHTADFTGDLSTFIERLKLAASINLLLPGARMVWQFGELGYDYSINYNGRTGNKPVRWDYYDHPQRKELHDFYKTILNLRKDHEVFHHLVAYDLNSWVKWMRFEHKGVVAVVASNFQAWESGDAQNGSQVQQITGMDVATVFGTDNCQWYDLLAQNETALTLGTTFDLTAGQTLLYSNVDLKSGGQKTESAAVGDVSWNVSWDDTNITFEVIGAKLDEAAVIYMDADPVHPANGGTDADGTLVGFNYDNAIINPPFRADFVSYIKNGYREYRTANGSNSWSVQTNVTATWTYSESICSDRRKITIPWTAITGAGKPAAFNWHGYLVYDNTNTGTYGAVPSFSGFESDYGLSGSGPYTRDNVRFYRVSGEGNSAFEDVVYAHDGSIIGSFGNITVSDMLFNRGGTVSLNAGATWDIEGSLYIGSSTTINAGDATLNLSGTSFELTSGSTFNAGTSTLVINGDEPFTLTGDLILHDLVVNNAAGVTIDGTLTITGTLTLQSGVIHTTSTDLLVIEENGSINEAIGAGSFVDGPLRKIGNAAAGFFFPVGDQNTYAPLATEDVSGGAATDHFTVTYHGSAYGTNTERNVANPDPGVFERVSAVEWWDVERNGTVEAKLRLHLNDLNRSGITDLSKIVVAHFNGTEWVSEGGIPADYEVEGSIVTTNRMTSFSPIAPGGPIDQPLPVTLVSFTGNDKGNGQVALHWETVFEEDNSHFDILMSEDGKTFLPIASVEGKNRRHGAKYVFNFNHNTSGIIYFQLRQVDFDGKEDLSDIIAVNIGAVKPNPFQWVVYPNPARSSVIKVKPKNAELANFTHVDVEIYDLMGRTVYAQNISRSSSGNTIEIRVPGNVQPGLYFIKLNNGQQVFQSRLIYDPVN